MHFRNYGLQKTWLDKYLRTPFETEQAKGAWKRLKSAWHHFYHILLSICRKLSFKMSLLVKCEIVEAFVNTLTNDYKYSLCDNENFSQPIQTQSSKKQKTFFELCPVFLKSR